jgi:hypothetical protein
VAERAASAKPGISAAARERIGGDPTSDRQRHLTDLTELAEPGPAGALCGPIGGPSIALTQGAAVPTPGGQAGSGGEGPGLRAPGRDGTELTGERPAGKDSRRVWLLTPNVVTLALIDLSVADNLALWATVRRREIAVSGRAWR